MQQETQTTRVSALAALVAESRELLERTRGTVSWIELAKNESAVRERLVQLLQPPVSAEETVAIRSQLEELLDINRETVARVEGRMAEAFSTLEHMVLVRRAAQAYGSAAGV